MPRWVVGNMSTGEILADISDSTSAWQATLNDGGTFNANTPLWEYWDAARTARTVPIRDRTIPWDNYLAAISLDGTRVLCGGPISGRPYDAPNASVNIQAAGMWALMNKRVVAPALTSGQRLNQVSTSYANLSLGTIAKRLVEQAMGWGELPIDLPAEVPGTNTRTYPGANGNLTGDMLANITAVRNGPDIAFDPYLADDRTIRWRMRTGTPTDPFIHQAGTPVFQYVVPESGVSGLSIEEASGNMVSTAFQIGGDSSQVLVGQYTDQTIPNRGGTPLHSVVNRSGVSKIGTLDDYAKDAATNGRLPQETWTIKFQQTERPFLSDYWVGDWCKLNIKGDPWIPDGSYNKRIVQLSGDGKDEQVAVTFMGDGDLQSYLDRQNTDDAQ